MKKYLIITCCMCFWITAFSQKFIVTQQSLCCKSSAKGYSIDSLFLQNPHCFQLIYFSQSQSIKSKIIYLFLAKNNELIGISLETKDTIYLKDNLYEIENEIPDSIVNVSNLIFSSNSRDDILDGIFIRYPSGIETSVFSFDGNTRSYLSSSQNNLLYSSLFWMEVFKKYDELLAKKKKKVHCGKSSTE